MKQVLLFLILSYSISAQHWQWAKKIPFEHHNTLKSAIDDFGNIYLAGDFDSTSTLKVPVVYKLDSNGTVLTRHILDRNLIVDDIEMNAQNQLMISGCFYDTLQFGSTQFISQGNEDIFIGAFNTNLQFQWAKAIGGPLYDRACAMAIDDNDNLFVCGRVADTLNFEGTILKCYSTGSSFVARFNSTGQMVWVTKDSTDALYPTSYSYSYANNIVINKNNELLLTGRFDLLNYFYLKGKPLTIAPLDPYGYNYGYDYAYKLDENGVVVWDTCIKKPKFIDYEYTGFCSTQSLILANYSFNGDHNSAFTLLDANGAPYEYVNVDSLVHAESSVEQLGVIDDKILLLVKRYVYDSLGRFHDYICSINNGQLNILDSIRDTDTWHTSLLKKSTNNFYLTGVFNEKLLAGNHLIKTDSTGNYMGQYNFYAYNPFVARLSLALTAGIVGNDFDATTIQLYPNPSEGIFIVQMQKPQTSTEIRVYDVLGNCVCARTFKNWRQQTIDLTACSKGIYVVEVRADNYQAKRKVIIN